MVGPLDPTPDGKDYAEDESEAANRQNAKAEQAIEDEGFGEPGGEDAHSAGGAGPTGQPHATTKHEGMETQGGDDDRTVGAEGGMLGEGV